jgi:2-keto-4-pentenoate hydratase
MRCARRGRPLRAGCLVSTGAASGIHDILPGQSAALVFDGVGTLRCRAVPATPARAGVG